MKEPPLLLLVVFGHTYCMFICLSLQLHHMAEYKYMQQQQMDKENPTVFGHYLNTHWSNNVRYQPIFERIRASPSGVVYESLGNHYRGLCITSISQVSVNNLSFKN